MSLLHTEIASSCEPPQSNKCYVHPAIIEAYLDGTLLPVLVQQAKQAPSASLAGLQPDEFMVLAFLQDQQQGE
ncbi:MAG: hypothetical protein H0W02_04710 [Ktedonobacteraceae bacterium]|nr:hypothetical protein [Ktedonobacteraceae bacterium]